MSYKYLRLYTNAYAFQVIVTRAAAAKSQGSLVANETPHMGVPSLPDARFIYESVNAAKSLLSIINSYIDLETCLRFLPLRFSLYCVNSAVFLYKAWSFEVLSAQEKLGIRHMINDVIRRLQKASVRPNDFSSRYSELLDRLWQCKDSESQAQSRAKSPHLPNASTTLPTATNNGTNIAGNNGRVQEPANFLVPATPFRGRALSSTRFGIGMQDEFSWLDLQAVGELVSGRGNGTSGDLIGWGGGMDGFGYGSGMGMNGFGAGEWDGFGGVEGDDVGRFF